MSDPSVVQMVIDDVVFQYLDLIEEKFPELVQLVDGTVYVNPAVMVHAARSAAESLAESTDDPNVHVGAAIVSDTMLSIGQALVTRYMEFGPEGVVIE